MKRVAVFGAGLVSGPLVRYLLARENVAVTVADRDGDKAVRLVAGHALGRAVALSLDDAAGVASLLRETDLVVSLLPATLHVPLAEAAIAMRKPVVTTSYVSPEMAALDGAAREAGVLVLNEIGLDPGLDHMSAMRMIDAIRRQGGRVVSFTSCCGGLPAPEAAGNPWRYKFSWSPRGVLLAGRNAARWLENHEIVEVSGAELFARARPYDLEELGRLEVYPNRDAISYVAAYGIEGVHTMFRGTLRWPGWCATLDAVARLGLLDLDAREWRPGTTCMEFTESLVGDGPEPLRERVARHLGRPADHPVLERLAWAGLFSSDPIGTTGASRLDVFCALLSARMNYGPGERDLVALEHRFGIVGGDGRPRTIVSTLCAYGEPFGETAMSRTVSLPAAVAARLILDGRIGLTGVRVPVHREIYEPVLGELRAMGVSFEERTLPS